jgi:hypothetical protein
MTDNSTADLPDPFVDDPELRLIIEIDPEAGHWLWPEDRLDLDGYGLIYREGYNWRAHRYVWALVVGLTELPLDHVCRVRRCVNPEHLEPVTTQVNNERIPTWGGNAETCSQGHLFDEANTITRADGKRRCRKCHAAQERDRRARRRAAGDTP